MGPSDYAADMAASDEAAEHLDQAIEELRDVLGRLSLSAGDRSLAPEIDVYASVGGEDQPVLVIEVKVALEAEFAAADWPASEVAEIKRRVREAVRGTVADRYDWFVSVRTQAGAVA